MLYAIAKINGKQYKLTESQELTVDRMPAKIGQKADIKDILLVSQDDTKLIGKDAEKATIKASVTAELLGPKILVFKHKKRKRYRKLVGHRQPLSKIKIESIDFPGKKPVGSKKPKVAEREETFTKEEKAAKKSTAEKKQTEPPKVTSKKPSKK